MSKRVRERLRNSDVNDVIMYSFVSFLSFMRKRNKNFILDEGVENRGREREGMDTQFLRVEFILMCRVGGWGEVEAYIYLFFELYRFLILEISALLMLLLVLLCLLRVFENATFLLLRAIRRGASSDPPTPSREIDQEMCVY